LVEPLYDFVVQNYIMDGFRFFQFLTAFESSSSLKVVAGEKFYMSF